MTTRKSFMALLASLFMVAASGCGSDATTPTSTDRPQNTATGAPTQEQPATWSPARIELQRSYEALRSAHTAIAAIWENLADGQQVSCGQVPDVPKPDSISAGNDPSLDTLAQTLRQAAIDTNRAATLWKTECANPRSTLPQQVINEGLLATRTAGSSLDSVESMLSAAQP